MIDLPHYDTLSVRGDRGTVFVLLDRPAVRNAMNFAMVDELTGLFELVAGDRGVRTIVLRGAGGHFCAGGDIREMAALRGLPRVAGADDPLATGNRRFGAMLARVDGAPQAVIAVLEGSVMGGGLGLACTSDLAIARADARFRLPETGLGLPPAQISPFLVRRIGLTQARRLAVTGADLDGLTARALGIVHEVVDSEAALELALSTAIDAISRGAPGAIATTKSLMLEMSRTADLERTLDRGAELFALALRSPEGAEGATAFLQRRRPHWDDRSRDDDAR